jgi:hypothetical protein
VIRKIGILLPHHDENGHRDFAKPALGLLVARLGSERERLGVARLVEAGHDLAPVLVQVEGSLTGIELGQVGLSRKQQPTAVP